MPTQILGDEQRHRFGRFAEMPGQDELTRYFHFDEADRARIARLRGAHNRVGFALQLGAVRFLGTFSDDSSSIPDQMVSIVAQQLGEREEPSLDAYWRGRQRWRHVALIREMYGFRDFGNAPTARFRLTRWLYALCWAGDDRPGLLMERTCHWLMANKILLPGVSTLERLIARIRHRIQNKRWEILAGSFTADQRRRIDRFFDHDGSGPISLDELRSSPRALATGELIRHLERIDAIRTQELVPGSIGNVPALVIERLARSGKTMRMTALVRMPEPRRTAMLAALFHSLEAIAQDDAIELFEGLMNEVVNEAGKAYNTARMRSLRDLDKAALMLADVAELAIFEPVEDGPSIIDKQAELLRRSGRDEIRAAMERARHLARPPDDRHFEELCAYWRRVHRLFKALLQRITFDANPIAEPVKEALDFLAGLENWTKGSLKGAPTACIGPAWKRHVFDGGNMSAPTNNRAFVFSVLEAMRKALKRRDIFVQSSIRFANPTRGLLDDKTWLSSRPTILRALGRSADAEFEISRLGNQLDLAYRRTIDHLPKNPDLRFENGELVVTQLDKLDDPASLVALRKQIHRRLPKVELPEILLETAARTGFARAFTHLSEKHARVDSFDISLCAVLIAEACNIGIEPLIRDDYPPLRRDRTRP